MNSPSVDIDVQEFQTNIPDIIHIEEQQAFMDSSELLQLVFHSNTELGKAHTNLSEVLD